MADSLSFILKSHSLSSAVMDLVSVGCDKWWFPLCSAPDSHSQIKLEKKKLPLRVLADLHILSPNWRIKSSCHHCREVKGRIFFPHSQFFPTINRKWCIWFAANYFWSGIDWSSQATQEVPESFFTPTPSAPHPLTFPLLTVQFTYQHQYYSFIGRGCSLKSWKTAAGGARQKQKHLNTEWESVYLAPLLQHNHFLGRLVCVFTRGFRGGEVVLTANFSLL